MIQIVFAFLFIGSVFYLLLLLREAFFSLIDFNFKGVERYLINAVVCFLICYSFACGMAGMSMAETITYFIEHCKRFPDYIT